MKSTSTLTQYDGCTYADIVSAIDDLCALDADPNGAALALHAILQRDGMLYAVAANDADGQCEPVMPVFKYTDVLDARDECRESRRSVSTLAVYGTGEDEDASILAETIVFYD